jgi:hypothetical protein
LGEARPEAGIPLKEFFDTGMSFSGKGKGEVVVQLRKQTDLLTSILRVLSGGTTRGIGGGGGIQLVLLVVWVG